ncbi:MAG: choice-of-anchor tandem repeat GloVer-containing protein [Candidatus Cybelea sp.]
MVKVCLGRCALGVAVAIALLAGCVSSESTPVLPMPQMSRSSTTPEGNGYKILYRFQGGSDGATPDAGLTAYNGTFYGTTASDGASGFGTAFQITTSGKESVIHGFIGSPKDGAEPEGVLKVVKGELYGASVGGGTDGQGTIFKVSTSGRERVLYDFKGAAGDGAMPSSGLTVLGGRLYGTTTYGGESSACASASCGTVFEVTLSGIERMLYAFKGGADGSWPFAAVVVINGTLYGTTAYGGANGKGTIFSLSASGKERVIYSFKGGKDGARPYGGLAVMSSRLYGTTYAGGISSKCSFYVGCGTVFEVTTSGAERVLYRFGGYPSDGEGPVSDLVPFNGLLYGTTRYGGSTACHPASGIVGCGTVFKISTSGSETVLNSFNGGKDGESPSGRLAAFNGKLYGATDFGGRGACNDPSGDGCGTVFELSP